MADIAGDWTIHQSNGFTVNLRANPPDAQGKFTGDANYGATAGPVEGNLSGDTVVFIVDWAPPGGTRGRYSGTFTDLGGARRWAGVSVDLAHLGSQATWYAHPAASG